MVYMPTGDPCSQQQGQPFVPEDATLPFFAYGLFKPGEPLHRYLTEFLEDPPVPGAVRGSLLIRDGLPLLKDGSTERVDGYVMRFRPGQGADGYEAIGSRESRELYRWKPLDLTDRPGLRVNALVGKSPDRGSVAAEGTTWRSGSDTVLRDGLALIRQIAGKYGNAPFDSAPPESFEWVRLFRLHMAYLFVWTVIERYATLAYGPALRPNQKARALGDDPLFGEILAATTDRSDRLFSSEEPAGHPYRLDTSNPQRSAMYYFQVRNNLTHRGKGAWQDAERVRKSLLELLRIIEQIVDQTPGLTVHDRL
jgi:hypothetical protein